MEVLELLLSNISEAIPISKCSGLFSFNSYICGIHAYRQNWDPSLGRRYSCTTEEKNEHDEYAVAVVNGLLPIWPNGWVFVYELSGCRFESSCSHW